MTPQVFDESTSIVEYADDWYDPDQLSNDLDAFAARDILIEVEVHYVKIAGATVPASIFASWIRANFGNLALGIVAVRNIAGTSTWSQHAYGNAVDVMCSGDLHRTIAYAVDSNRGPLSIAHLLADPYFPSPLGDHYGHVHADFYPQWGGTPPGHPV